MAGEGSNGLDVELPKGSEPGTIRVSENLDPGREKLAARFDPALSQSLVGRITGTYRFLVESPSTPPNAKSPQMDLFQLGVLPKAVIDVGYSAGPIQSDSAGDYFEVSTSEDSAQISLSGARSQPGSSPLQKFLWSEDGEFLGEGKSFELRFPVGIHRVSLRVVDGQSESDTHTVSITVLRKATTSEPVRIEMFTPVPSPPRADLDFSFVITGQGFDADSTVVFFGPGCRDPGCPVGDGITSVSSSEIKGKALLAKGRFSVIVKDNRSGASSNAVEFNVLGDPPTIQSIDPRSVKALRPTTLVVRGRDFPRDLRPGLLRGLVSLYCNLPR